MTTEQDLKRLYEFLSKDLAKHMIEFESYEDPQCKMVILISMQAILTHLIEAHHGLHLLKRK